MKLGEKDLRLLAYLYHSSRESITEIAKNTGLTRTQAEYKFNQFLKEKIIEGFFTMYDYSAFGYHIYSLGLFKLARYNLFKKVLKKLEKSKNCISCGRCFGKFDIFANLIFRDKADLNRFESELGKDVSCLLMKPYLSEFHPLKVFYDKSRLILPLVPSGRKIALDKTEIRMAKLLENNGRIRIIDLARKLNISGELALYKLRNLKKKKVILGCKAGVRMERLGWDYSIILLQIKDFSPEMRNKITSFARQNKYVNALVLSHNQPNCLIQIFHRSGQELKQGISKVKDILEDKEYDLQVLLAESEKEINTLPFLD